MYTYADSFFVCAEEQTITQIDPPPVSRAGSRVLPKKTNELQWQRIVTKWVRARVA